ncbi:MAG: phospholipase D-like domain-containing protein [Desulfurivibrionaceae bacterium]|nr:phospholipase D-like domain-containing protein [Desulfurivibrionaceae bacterium]
MASPPATQTARGRRPGLGFLFRLLLLPPCLLLFLGQAAAGQININTALVEELATLPYIGTNRARALVRHRELHGPFRRGDDLLAVANLGPKSVEAILPHLDLPGLSDRHGQAIFAGSQVMLLTDQEYFPVLLNFVKDASQRIDLAMYLFKTTKSAQNRPSLLVEELLKAGRRGVQVQIVLEKSGYNDFLNRENQRLAEQLQQENITVRFDALAKTTHTKMVLIDSRFCFVGSHNFTHSALAFNHELSLLLDNRALAGELLTYLAAIETGAPL